MLEKKTFRYTIQTKQLIGNQPWHNPMNVELSEDSLWSEIELSRDLTVLRSACRQYISEIHSTSKLTIKFSNKNRFCVTWIDEKVKRWWCCEFKNYRLEGQVLVYSNNNLP